MGDADEALNLDEGVRGGEVTFFIEVFGWMTLALLFTGVAAWLFENQGGANWMVNNFGWWLVLIVTTLIVGGVLAGSDLNFPIPVMIFLFLIVSTLLGVALTPLLAIYSASTASLAFFLAAGMFGGASLYGMLSNRNLGRWKNLLMMSVWGLVLVGVVAGLLLGGVADTVVSVLVVLVFTIITAAEINELRDNFSHGLAIDSNMRREALHSSLILYLAFINIYIHLMRLVDRD